MLVISVFAKFSSYKNSTIQSAATNTDESLAQIVPKSNHSSQNMRSEKSSIYNLYKEKKLKPNSARHLFGIAAREKEHYDYKKSELRFLRNYLKDLLHKIQQLPEENSRKEKRIVENIDITGETNLSRSNTGSSNLSELFEKINVHIKHKKDYIDFTSTQNNNTNAKEVNEKVIDMVSGSNLEVQNSVVNVLKSSDSSLKDQKSIVDNNNTFFVIENDSKPNKFLPNQTLAVILEYICGFIDFLVISKLCFRLL